MSVLTTLLIMMYIEHMGTNTNTKTTDTVHKSVGWDGHNQPIIEVWLGCGCKFNRDASYLVDQCHEHFLQPCAEQLAEAQRFIAEEVAS